MMKSDFLKKRLAREFESISHAEMEDYLLVHSFPGFWTVQALPQSIESPELVEEYAQSRAKEGGTHVVLVRNGREFVHFYSDGRKTRTVKHVVSET